MWSPPNKQALPSQDEIKCAREAINELESELEVAIQVLERAKMHVATLTQDLEERKAWIAPVRKVPIEILSEIFIFMSEVNDLSPVTITEVCRFWRKVILSTPRAWSLIYADRLEGDSVYADAWGHIPKINRLPVQYFSTFIQRSNPCMLHITMPPDQDHFDENFDDLVVQHPAQKVLVSAINRIQCLSTPSPQIVELEAKVFPNLTRLTLLIGEIAPGFFNRSRFPCLRYLDCTNCPLDNSPVGTTLFPPLQHLGINIQYSGWIELVRGCADTLVSLDVLESNGTERIPGAAIGFPNLHSIAFGTRSNLMTDLIWPIQATTPSLQSYEQMRQDGMLQSTVHHDVKHVTHIYTNQMMDLEEFVTLRVLQVELYGHKSLLYVIRTILHRLKENKDICPVLQTIRFSLSEEDYGDSFKSLIPGFHSTVWRARPELMLCFIANSHMPLPGSFEGAEVGIVAFLVLDIPNFPQCGPNMPCVLKRDQI